MVVVSSIAPPPAVAISPSSFRFHRHNQSSVTVPLLEPPTLRPPLTRTNAGLTEVEPDLEDDKRDRWRTNGILPEDFKFGEYDGHHTYHEGNEGPFWDAVVSEYQAAEPPTGFQGLISWLFLPAIGAGIAYHVPVPHFRRLHSIKYTSISLFPYVLNCSCRSNACSSIPTGSATPMRDNSLYLRKDISVYGNV